MSTEENQPPSQKQNPDQSSSHPQSYILKKFSAHLEKVSGNSFYYESKKKIESKSNKSHSSFFTSDVPVKFEVSKNFFSLSVKGEVDKSQKKIEKQGEETTDQKISSEAQTQTDINSSEIMIINKKTYLENLFKSFEIYSKNKNFSNNNRNGIKNDCYLLLKQFDENTIDNSINKNNYILKEIICPLNQKDFENQVVKFLTQNQNDSNNNIKPNNSIRLCNCTMISGKDQNNNNNNNSYITQIQKKKSKLNNKKMTSTSPIKKSPLKNSLNNSISTGVNTNSFSNLISPLMKSDFNPIFILDENLLKSLLKSIQQQKGTYANYSIVNSSKFKILSISSKQKYNKLNSLDYINNNINQNVYEINETKEYKEKRFIFDINSISLEKIIKFSLLKPQKKLEKTFEDFTQSTPLSLLQEKYFIYAVSKWAKFSKPQMQEQVYYLNYNTGNNKKYPGFDISYLNEDNFTLWIEKIKVKNKEETKKNSYTNSVTSLKRNKSKSKLTNEMKKK